MNRPRFVLPLAGLAVAAALLPGCSIRGYAINKVGDALAGTGSSFGSDDDPELIGDASPFGLKTMESLLEESPRHKGLLLAATRGFVQYAYGWVQMDADALEATDLARATAMRERSRRLYLRARDYGLRGLEVDLPGLRAALARDPKAALAKAKKDQVPLLYWTAMAWGAALTLKVNDSGGERRSADRRSAGAARARAGRGLGPRLDPRVPAGVGGGALFDRRLDRTRPRALPEGPGLRRGQAGHPVRDLRPEHLHPDAGQGRRSRSRSRRPSPST